MELILAAIVGYFLLAGKSKSSPVTPSDKIPDAPPPPVDYHPIKDRFDIAIKKYASIYGIPWQVIKAHIAVETDYGTTPQVMERKLGSGNKRGILGITENTFLSVNKMIGANYKPDDLWKAEVSIEIGTALIRSNTIAISKDKEFFTRDFSGYTELQKKLQQENLIRIVMSYNAGVGAVQKGTYSQSTKDYFNKWATAFQEITERQGVA